MVCERDWHAASLGVDDLPFVFAVYQREVAGEEETGFGHGGGGGVEVW